MRSIVSVAALVLAVAALSGCAATSPGAGQPGKGGGAVSASNECSVAHDALAKVVKGQLSAPYQQSDKCYFGVGPNGSKSGSALGQLYADAVVVRLTASDVDSTYQGAKIAYSGSKPLSGVGTEAAYYDGGNGNPQIVARSAGAFCSVQTFFNDASEVGLAKPSGSRTIAAADVPKLAADLGGICTTLFGG